jgi:hypothetical protein
VAGLVHRYRHLAEIGVGVQVDAGEVGRFAHEDDTEQEEGADGGGCADVGELAGTASITWLSPP